MKRTYLWLTFGLALFIAVPLRLYQQFCLVDSQGFYTGGDWVSWALLAVLLCAAAVLVVGSLVNRSLPKRFTQTRSIPSGVFQLGLGAAAIISSIQEIMRLARPPQDGHGGAAGSLLYIAIILAFVGIGAGVVWLVNGISNFAGKNFLRRMPAAGILPPIWMAILLFSQSVQFSGNSIALNESESQLSALALIFMTLFVFNHNKMIAGAQGKKCGKRVHGYGLSMALFGIIGAMPAIISLIRGTADPGAMGLAMSFVALAMAASVIVFLIDLPRGKEAFVAEFIEEEAEEEVDREAAKAAKAERVKQEGSLLVRAVKAILQALADINLKIRERRGRRNKVVDWKPGELDEPATMRLDETWRLDFYGFESETDEPYRAKAYEIDEEEQKIRDARRAVAQAETERIFTEEEELRKLPRWKQKQVLRERERKEAEKRQQEAAERETEAEDSSPKS